MNRQAGLTQGVIRDQVDGVEQFDNPSQNRRLNLS